MAYEEPVVKVLSANRQGDVVYLRLKVIDRNSWPSSPLAPAGLYQIDNPEQEHFQLHRFISQDADTLSYKTYDQTSPLPRVGQRALFRVWWTEWQLKLVLDQDREWVRRAYPDNGEHDHCALTWETIAAYSDHSEGYESEGDWITVEAYEVFILQDRLRLRRRHSPS